MPFPPTPLLLERLPATVATVGNRGNRAPKVGWSPALGLGPSARGPRAQTQAVETMYDNRSCNRCRLIYGALKARGVEHMAASGRGPRPYPVATLGSKSAPLTRGPTSPRSAPTPKIKPSPRVGHPGERNLSREAMRDRAGDGWKSGPDDSLAQRGGELAPPRGWKVGM